jgi:hypothetical protein
MKAFVVMAASALLASTWSMSVNAQDDDMDIGMPDIDAAEAADMRVVPRPAEIMPKATSAIALDAVWTGERYVVVGDRGHILVSADAKTWVQAPVPVRAALTAVHFANPMLGWAVGHDAVILRTEDGGRSWNLLNFEPELERPFLDVIFLDEERGFAVGAYGMAYATEDGGDTWEELDIPAIQEDEFHFNSITRLADGTLFISGEFGLLAASRDEGQTWRRLQPPYESSLFGALPYGDRGVMIFGLRGNVFIAKNVADVPVIDDDFDPMVLDPDSLTGEGWRGIELDTVASMFGGVSLPDGRYALVGLNGRVVFLDADGNFESLAASRSGMPLSAAVAVSDGLLVVGEGGIEFVGSR